MLSCWEGTGQQHQLVVLHWVRVKMVRLGINPGHSLETGAWWLMGCGPSVADELKGPGDFIVPSLGFY